MKIGDKFKSGKSEYTVVSVFVDNGREFYVAKKVGSDGFVTYSNVFTYDEEGKLYKRS
jgi:hypothetical protein